MYVVHVFMCVCVLQARVCDTVAELAVSDLNAACIRDNNGIYMIATLLLLPLPTPHSRRQVRAAPLVRVKVCVCVRERAP